MGVGFALLLSLAKGICHGQEWEYLGLHDQYVTNVVVKGSDTIYASTPRLVGVTAGVIFKTANAGATWDSVLSDAGTQDLELHPRNTEILYAGMGGFYPPYGILKTTNGGTNWFHADSGIVADGDHGVQTISFDPSNPEILYAGTSGAFPGDVFKSTDSGTSWTALACPSSGMVVAVDPESTETIYAGKYSLYKSWNGGKTWFLTGLQTNGITSFCIDPQDHLLIYAGTTSDEGGLQKSIDGGISWEMANLGLPPQSSAAEIVVDPTSRFVYVSVAGYPDTGGVYRSTDLGQSWTALQGLPTGSNKFRGLTLSTAFDALYVAIVDYGIYRTSLATSVVQPKDLPQDNFILYPTYPNPFNGVTVIQYELAGVEEVNIAVYDLLGRRVARLVSGKQGPGRHRALFDAKGLSTGVYLCRVSTSRPDIITKLVMIK